VFRIVRENGADFFRERVYALYDVTFWWHEYGKEVLLLKDV
jgi:hypothetical protein